MVFVRTAWNSPKTGEKLARQDAKTQRNPIRSAHFLRETHLCLRLRRAVFIGGYPFSASCHGRRLSETSLIVFHSFGRKRTQHLDRVFKRHPDFYGQQFSPIHLLGIFVSTLEKILDGFCAHDDLSFSLVHLLSSTGLEEGYRVPLYTRPELPFQFPAKT
jgi:hypothetical protein